MHIKYAIEMEQFLMEGSYNKVLTAKQGMPAASYGYFVDLLATTVKAEVASCCEKVYQHLSFSEAMKMLKLSTASELRSFCESRGWAARDGVVYFQNEQKPALGAKDIPSLQIIGQTLSYAKELELIV